MTPAMKASDATFTAWQRANLAHAAELFDLAVRGEPVFGWRLRSIGTPATGARRGNRPHRTLARPQHPQTHPARPGCAATPTCRHPTAREGTIRTLDPAVTPG